MSRVLLLLAFCFFFFANGFSQEVENADYDFWNFQQDSPLYVFSNKAYLRSDADVNSKIIDLFPFGTKLFYKQGTKGRGIIKGIFAPWIKVSTENNKEGFIWAGALAFAQIASNDIHFVCGIDRTDKRKMKGRETRLYYVVQLKALKDNRLVNFGEWKIESDESNKFTEIKLLGDVKLTNLLNVVRVSFGGEACGIPMNYYYYGWTGKELLELPTKYSVGDAGVFYHSETLLFPNEPGGQANKIIKLTEEVEVFEEATETIKEKVKKSNSREVYVWDGKKALLQKHK